MALKFVILSALVAVTLARSQYSYAPAPAEPVDPPKYDFDWAVSDSDSSNHFGQQESRDRDSTKGEYKVLLPDGRTQVVTYYVNGDSGFIADVSYEGQTRSYAAPPKPRYG